MQLHFPVPDDIVEMIKNKTIDDNPEYEAEWHQFLIVNADKMVIDIAYGKKTVMFIENLNST